MSRPDAKWPDDESLGGGYQYFQDQDFSTQYEPLTPEQKQQRAANYRQIFEAPQQQAIDRRVQQAQTDADSRAQQIQANYAAYENQLNRQQAHQRSHDLESAVARGAGRSGVVNYDSRRRQEHFSELMAAEMARKHGELRGVRDQLDLVQRQAPVERQQLAEQASRLHAQELQRLQDLDYDRRRDMGQEQFQRALGVYDRTMLTPLEQLSLYIELANMAGKTPDDVPNIYGRFT